MLKYNMRTMLILDISMTRQIMKWFSLYWHFISFIVIIDET